MRQTSLRVSLAMSRGEGRGGGLSPESEQAGGFRGGGG
jgi:hypothetical protein